MTAVSTIDRLLKASAADRASLARAIVERGVPWPELRKRFSEILLREPQQGERAVHALEVASRRNHDALGVARLRLMRGMALRHCGSLSDASKLMLEAEVDLTAHGEHDHAMQSLLLAVDALGQAGEIDEALRCAARAASRIRGKRAPLYRAILRTNRANVLRLAGRLEEAADESDKAARAFRRLGQEPSAALAKMNAGVALMYAGHLQRAKRRFEHAEETFGDAGQAVRKLHAQYNMACLRVRAGEPGTGIVALEQIAADAKSHGRARLEALCRMDLADALRRVGDNGSAVKQARAALKTFERIDARVESVETRWLVGASLVHTDLERARTQLERAIHDATELGRTEYVLRGMLMLEQLHMLSGTLPDASRLARLWRRAKTAGVSEVVWRTQLLRIVVAIEIQQLARARALLSDLPRASAGHPWIAVAAETARARLELSDGERARAIRRLRTLTARIESMRGDLPGPWLRTKFLLEQLDPYLLLIDALLQRGRTPDREEAERILDGLALKRFMAGKSPRTGTGRMAALRKRLAVLYDALADQGGSTRSLNPAQRMALIDEIRAVEQAVAESWRRDERRRKRPAHAHTTDAPTRNPVGNQTYVHVWVQGHDVRCLTRTQHEIVDVGTLISLPALHKAARELRFHAHRVRVSDSASGARAFARAMTRLGDSLIAPIVRREALGHDTPRADLYFVLDERLGDLPWELLPVGGRLLAASRAVARVPALRLPRRSTRTRSTRTKVGRGLAAIVAGEAGLDGARREARALRAYGDVFTGRGATLDAAVRALGERDAVHFAMHGVASTDAPALGGVRLHDGWLTSADVPARLSTQLVCLAACQTGAPPGPAAEAWGALPRTLLRAGVRWVLWTSGDVDDESTADLMAALYARLGTAQFDDAEPGTMDVPGAFGHALSMVADDQRTAARLLPFRLSGGMP